MKIFLIIIFISGTVYGQDSTEIKQEIFFSPLINKYVLVTNNGSSYDNVLYGSIEFIEQQKPIEFNKAMLRRKPIATIKCKK